MAQYLKFGLEDTDQGLKDYMENTIGENIIEYVAHKHFLPRTLSELHRLYMKRIHKMSFRIKYGQFSFTFDTIKTASMIVIRHMNVTPFSRATHPQQHLGPLLSSDIEIVLF